MNVVQDEEELENNSTNFKFVPWETVAGAFDPPLIIDTQSYDPCNIAFLGTLDAYLSLTVKDGTTR
jgi:hypothetical protein